jgi:hypothetical protein
MNDPLSIYRAEKQAAVKRGARVITERHRIQPKRECTLDSEVEERKRAEKRARHQAVMQAWWNQRKKSAEHDASE